jgi:hypothetical protein
MAIMAALGTTAAKAVVGNVIGSLFGRKKNKAANAAQARAEAIQREQTDMARREQDWRFNELSPQLQAEQQRLNAMSETANQELSGLYGLNRDMAIDARDRMRNVWAPLEDQLVGEARYAGGASDQQFAANRAAADIGQAINIDERSKMRMARMYGGDPSRIAMAMGNNSANNALAKVTGMDRARNAARELGFDKRMQVSKLGDRTFNTFDNASRTAVNVGDTWVKSQTVPSQFALDSGRVVSGAGGNATSLYGSGGTAAAGMYDTAGRRAGQADSDFGRFFGLSTKDADLSSLWKRFGGSFGGSSGTGSGYDSSKNYFPYPEN